LDGDGRLPVPCPESSDHSTPASNSFAPARTQVASAPVSAFLPRLSTPPREPPPQGPETSPPSPRAAAPRFPPRFLHGPLTASSFWLQILSEFQGGRRRRVGPEQEAELQRFLRTVLPIRVAMDPRYGDEGARIRKRSYEADGRCEPGGPIEGARAPHRASYCGFVHPALPCAQSFAVCSGAQQHPSERSSPKVRRSSPSTLCASAPHVWPGRCLKNQAMLSKAATKTRRASL